MFLSIIYIKLIYIIKTKLLQLSHYYYTSVVSSAFLIEGGSSILREELEPDDCWERFLTLLELLELLELLLEFLESLESLDPVKDLDRESLALSFPFLIVSIISSHCPPYANLPNYF